MEMLIVDSNVCNDKSYTVMKMSSFSILKVFEVGDNSFSLVKGVELMGLKQLERVVIGRESFTEQKNERLLKSDPECYFNLKNCERLRELKIDRFSFSEYSKCEIENVPSLKVIEMGEVDEDSYNFFYASLELKSVSQRMK